MPKSVFSCLIAKVTQPELTLFKRKTSAPSLLKEQASARLSSSLLGLSSVPIQTLIFSSFKSLTRLEARLTANSGSTPNSALKTIQLSTKRFLMTKLPFFEYTLQHLLRQ